MRSQNGAAQLGVMDVLATLAILAILLYASWKQFPAYSRHREAASPLASPVSRDTPPMPH
jgi:Tfp pilus assembly protein PilE